MAAFAGIQIWDRPLWTDALDHLTTITGSTKSMTKKYLKLNIRHYCFLDFGAQTQRVFIFKSHKNENQIFDQKNFFLTRLLDVQGKEARIKRETNDKISFEDYLTLDQVTFCDINSKKKMASATTASYF